MAPPWGQRQVINEVNFCFSVIAALSAVWYKGFFSLKVQQDQKKCYASGIGLGETPCLVAECSEGIPFGANHIRFTLIL